MEAKARLVSESLARHGMDCALDHRRFHWSRWIPCEARCGLLLVPTRPGLFSIAEELIAPGNAAAREGEPMLAISVKDRAGQGRICARFTVLEDDRHDCSAQTGFQRWLMTRAAAGSGMVHHLDDCAEVPSSATEGEPERSTPTESRSEGRAADVHPPAPLPSDFWHGEPWRDALVD